MQSQIALSTMEDEYIALSQSKRDLIPVKEVLKEIMLVIFEKRFTPDCTTHSKAFQDGTPSKDGIIPHQKSLKITWRA
jgi:peroxiredoxin